MTRSPSIIDCLSVGHSLFFLLGTHLCLHLLSVVGFMLYLTWSGLEEEEENSEEHAEDLHGSAVGCVSQILKDRRRMMFV